MSPNPPKGCLVLLDACCIINLFATGRVEEILQSLPYDFATSHGIVATEVISVARASSPNAPMERELIPPSRLESLDALRILDLSGDEELAVFLQFAAQLDDGEASICALALSRGGALATDDRKTLRLLERQYPHLGVVQTPELLYEWVQLSKMPDDEAGRLLRAVQQRGRFYPRRDAPRFDWWESLSRERMR
jgi:hypothetical protein